jgi:hypothetical protein
MSCNRFSLKKSVGQVYTEFFDKTGAAFVNYHIAINIQNKDLVGTQQQLAFGYCIKSGSLHVAKFFL